MPLAEPILDPARVSLDEIVVGRDGIREWVPQRDQIEMLHGILYYDGDAGIAAGFHEVGGDEFWVPGHIPGRPLFPGVLMIETAAQLSCYAYCRSQANRQFFAFASLEDVRFRGTVVPGDRLLVMVKARKVRRVLGVYDSQAFVGDRRVFDGVITGMVLPAGAG